MRFLIVAAVLAYAAAAPAPAPAPTPEPAPGPPIGERLEATPPTISAGDINGAAIEAQVEFADNVRAAIDVDRQVNDKVAELEGQAINAADEQAWQAVDAVKTIEARLDGEAASAASIIAKNIVRGAAPGVPYANSASYGAGPIVQPTPSIRQLTASAGPIVQATAPVASVVPAPATYAAAPAAPIVQPAAPAAPIVQPAAPIVQSAAPIDAIVEASAPIAYAAPFEYASPYSGYPGPILDSNPFFNDAFNQGYYAPPLNYGSFW